MKITDKIVDLVIAGLENGTVPWRKTWKEFAPMNAFAQRPYNGLNVLLLAFLCKNKGYPYPLFGTVKQINDAGGRVKKGEKSCPVVYWNIMDWETVNDETGEIEKEKRFTPFYYSVFNLSQTEGIEIQNYVPETVIRINSPLEMCESVINHFPSPPEITHGSGGAFYAPRMDLVNVPELCRFDSSEEYYATTFHELAHATGHPKRLSRFKENEADFGKHSYNYEELVAEMAATFLCSHCGIEQTVENSVAYLTGWAKFLKENRKSILFGASTKAQAAVCHILGKEVEIEQTRQTVNYKEAAIN
jgi:antirestriction protein ArdC